MLVGQKIGPFTIDKELGAGAMGAVYRARHTETGERVAIKIVAPGLTANETAMKRFRREAEILKQLRHPNIVRLVTTGKFSGTPFYAMEYIEGESLDRAMSRRGRLSWEEVVTLGKQLCAALQHAHEKGIVHRDLKPSNVMLLADGTVKLTDFGIAKDLDLTSLTSAHCTVGTASYMSPEQCKGERNLTHKSDLYSMGVMFYELLTGSKPFTADNPMDMFMLHVQGEFERPSRIVLDIPVWMDNLVCQLMEKKPEQRPYDAEMVGEVLGRIKEKVEAQKSAGIEAIKKHVADRPYLDAQDKEAARTLLGLKKKKKKGRPFHQQRWFKAAVYAACLFGIAFVFYLLVLKAPSADALYKEAQTTMRFGTLQDKVEARKDGPIAQFLKYYPGEARVGAVQQWADEVDREKMEDWVVGRLRLGRKAEDANEELAQKAVKEEDEGKLREARLTWATLDQKNGGEKDAEKRGYALVARDHLNKLDVVDAEEKRLLDNVGLKGNAADFTPSGEQEVKAVEARRRELTDRARGRAEWERMQKELDRDNPDQRPWFLLAAKRVRLLHKQE
jgi:serine/threonine-protein kinase